MKEIFTNLLNNSGWLALVIYFALSMISILLHDFKYLFFLNSNSKITAIIICGAYTIFNTIITKNIASYDITTSCIIITITNCISMWVAMTYSEKQLKEYVYKFEITTKYADKRFELKDTFKDHNIPYQYSYYFYENDKINEQGIETNEFGEALYHKYEIYAYTKNHTRRLKEILSKYDQKDVKWISMNTSYYKD